jgi:hypothetical protein
VEVRVREQGHHAAAGEGVPRGLRDWRPPQDALKVFDEIYTSTCVHGKSII